MFRCYFLAFAGLLLSASNLTAQTPNAAPAPTATPAQKTMEEPQVGDHWTYESRDDITGEIKATYTSTVTDVSAADISVRNAFVGNPNFGYEVYDRSWNRLNNDQWHYNPSDGGGIKAPLAVGNTWSVNGTDLNNTAGATWTRSVSAKVAAQESVTTRAGTFDSFKIAITIDYLNSKDPTRKLQETRQMWYAPAIDHWVKQASVMRADGRVRNSSSAELIEYGRR